MLMVFLPVCYHVGSCNTLCGGAAKYHNSCFIDKETFLQKEVEEEKKQVEKMEEEKKGRKRKNGRKRKEGRKEGRKGDI